MSKIIDEYVNHSHKKSSNYLLKVRLWFYSITYCLTVVIAYILLRIDFTASTDPMVRLYHHNRWLLITSWFNKTCLSFIYFEPMTLFIGVVVAYRTDWRMFYSRRLNLISIVYTPICIYCDWRELRRSNEVRHVKILNNIRFVCFTSIQFPSTSFSDILFWKLWLKDRELIAPVAVDVLVPMWLQHCLHTVTLVVIILDLLLVPRRRPKNLTLGVIVLSIFLSAYAVTCGRSIINNEHIYPLLRLFSGYNFFTLVLFVSVEHFFYFTIQWLIVDLLWGQRTPTHALMSLLFSTNRRREINEANAATTERKSTKDTIKSQKHLKKLKNT